MKRIFVTGAAGFIGWQTVVNLLGKGCTVLGVDDLNDYYDVRLKQWRLSQLRKHGSFSFQQMDITDRQATETSVRAFRPDAIISLAARAGVRYSVVNPDIYFRTNVLGTLYLLETARNLGVPKFIMASTSSLYAGEKTPFSEDLPVNRPLSPYAASKKAAEATCYTYHYLYDLDVTIFRYFTVYGPCGRPDLSIFKFIHLISMDRPITVFGDGSQSRDFTYVSDIAEGTVRGLALKGFQTVNLGGNHPHTLMELIALIEQAVGKKAEIRNQPFHKADVMATWADISRAGRLLDWRPQVTLEEGVRRTARWHLENRDWLEDIALID